MATNASRVTNCNKSDFYLEQFVGDTTTDANGDCVTRIRDVQMNRVPIVEIIRNMVRILGLS